MQTPRFTALLLAPALALGLGVATPQDAEACSPPQSMALSSVPESGQRWPANAAILFEGYGLYSDGFSATVNGQPVEVEMVDALRGRGNNITGFFEAQNYGLRLNPSPAPGSTVVVQWAGCVDGCPSYTLRYTASAAVEPPPLRPPQARFDLAYYDGITVDGATCYYLTDLSYAWHLDLAAQGGGDYPVALSIQPYGVDGSEALHPQNRYDEGGGVEAVYYGDSEAVSGLPAAESLCFQVRAHDLFGQASEPITTCLPCNIATPELPPPFNYDSQGNPIYGGVPEEPEWMSVAEPYCGGLCDTGDDCAEEGEGEPGPGCATAPGAGASLAGLLLLGVFYRRRRRGGAQA